MLKYNLSENVTAFTTTKRYGRDKEAICEALGVPAGRFARPHQVHGCVVRQLTEADFSTPALLEPYSEIMEGVDAVIYDVREACIGISTADCIPVLCYDPEHHCAAAIHAGWRGTVQRIVSKAVGEMERVYGSNPALLRCAIGPGIEMESFEVGDEVYQAFADAQFDMTDIARRYPARNVTDTPMKWHLDIKFCNKQQLMLAGVPEENIEMCSIDTMTDERFYSARREGAATGRILSGIVLR